MHQLFHKLQIFKILLKKTHPEVELNRIKVSEVQTNKFLPQLPQKRSKPIWSNTSPSFVLNESSTKVGKK